MRRRRSDSASGWLPLTSVVDVVLEELGRGVGIEAALELGVALVGDLLGDDMAIDEGDVAHAVVASGEGAGEGAASLQRLQAVVSDIGAEGGLAVVEALVLGHEVFFGGVADGGQGGGAVVGGVEVVVDAVEAPVLPGILLAVALEAGGWTRGRRRR